MTEKKKLASEWHLEGNWDVTEGKMHGWISLSPIGPPLFELIPLTGTEDEIEASARLIAAAPEVTESAIHLVDRDCVINGNKIIIEFDDHGDAFNALLNLRAALSKAKAETRNEKEGE